MYGSMAAFGDMTVGRKVYVHMNNTNPVLRPYSDERAAVEAAGWTVAEDGMGNRHMTASPAKFEARLRQIGKERYHDKHPFHILLHFRRLHPRSGACVGDQSVLLSSQHPHERCRLHEPRRRPRAAPRVAFADRRS